MPFGCAFLVFALGMPGAAHAVTFTGPTTIAVGSAPQSVVTGSFNADADPDLAVVNQGSNNVSVLLGGAAASFSAPTNVVAGTTPLAVVAADFNGDADPELAVVNEASNDVSILTGGAGGTFSAPSNFVVGTTPQSLGVGDFNGDFDRDLAVVNEGSATCRSCSAAPAQPSALPPTSASAGCPARSLSVTSTVTRTRTSPSQTRPPTTSRSWSVAPREPSPGRRTSRSAVHPRGSPSGTLRRRLGPGPRRRQRALPQHLSTSRRRGAGFGTATNFATGNLPDGVTWASSAATRTRTSSVANQGSDNVSILVGDVGGSFVGPTDFASGDGPTSVAVADFDADADQDFAITNELVDNLAILLRTRPRRIRAPQGRPADAHLARSRVCRVHRAEPGARAACARRCARNDASCAPPAQTSSFLTIGAPDANGAPVNFFASIRLGVIGVPAAPEDSDVAVAISVTDVRCRTGVSTCGAANNQAGPDYTGELTPTAAIRLTDGFNAVGAGGGTDRATVEDFPLGGPVQVPCTASGSMTIGSTCALDDHPRCRIAGHRARRQARRVAGRPGRGTRRRLGR